MTMLAYGGRSEGSVRLADETLIALPTDFADITSPELKHSSIPIQPFRMSESNDEGRDIFRLLASQNMGIHSTGAETCLKSGKNLWWHETLRHGRGCNLSRFRCFSIWKHLVCEEKGTAHGCYHSGVDVIFLPFPREGLRERDEAHLGSTVISLTKIACTNHRCP